MNKKKATKIYLVRHGEVQNPDNIFYGRKPGFGLSDKGKMQAHAMGKHLQGKPITAVYASPLQRTQETAHIITGYLQNPPITSDERLLEVLSPLEGKLLEELATIRFNFFKKTFIKKGGESIHDIFDRMLQAIMEIHTKHTGKHVLVVSHADPIMILRAFYLGDPLKVTSIRGSYYIPTAHGVELTMMDTKITVADIHPS
jgi:broad specificity phosphatase PhoE